MTEQTLSPVDQRLAASREKWRQHLTPAGRQATLVQSYDAAAVGGRMSGWRRPFTSANSEMEPALPMLRGGARELVRNNPHASRAVRVLESHIAGTGVRPRPDMSASGLGEAAIASQTAAARDQWTRFVENCDPEGLMDFYGQQRLMTRATVEGGEALRLWTPISDRGRIFWRCKVLEGDVLDHQRNQELRDGGRIVLGVEFDVIGRRVAYWLHDGHPGDRFSIATRLTSRRVPAELVDHCFEVLRPGQVRGVTWLTPVAITLRDVSDLCEAMLVKKKTEACIALVMTNAEGTPQGGLGSAALQGATDEAGTVMRDASGAAVERMRPGMIINAPPGWDVTPYSPTSAPDLVEHVKERLHAIAAGVGVTYSQMTGDMSGASYSSMREGRVEFNRLVDGWQDTLMIHQTARPAWRRVMDAAVMNGEIPARPRAKFIRPARPWVDPLKDQNAAINAAQAGIGSLTDIIERNGDDPDDVLAENLAWATKVRDSGLSFTINHMPEVPGDAA
jgi:lambda family phage portal protein